jgi:hypothetical protein
MEDASIPPEGTKVPNDGAPSIESYDTASREEPRAPPPPTIEYDTERVEKMYRKLDRRIIPGTVPLPGIVTLSLTKRRKHTQRRHTDN